jgi:hypothetical protein
MPLIDVRPGDVITADLLNRINQREWAPGIRSSGGISSRQTSDGQIQVWGEPSQVAAFVCQPSAAVTGATGTWPTITPVSFTADVYQVAGTTMTKITPNATIYNWYAASLVASKTVTVEPDGTGAYVAIAQSCT